MSERVYKFRVKVKSAVLGYKSGDWYYFELNGECIRELGQIWDLLDWSTLGLWTTLHDKNGTEIYGDDWILVGEEGAKKEKCRVGFENGCFGFYAPWGMKGGLIFNAFAHYPWESFQNCFEVVGSIHTHPNLLARKEE